MTEERENREREERGKRKRREREERGDKRERRGGGGAAAVGGPYQVADADGHVLSQLPAAAPHHPPRAAARLPELVPAG